MQNWIFPFFSTACATGGVLRGFCGDTHYRGKYRYPMPYRILLSDIGGPSADSPTVQCVSISKHSLSVTVFRTAPDALLVFYGVGPTHRATILIPAFQYSLQNRFHNSAGYAFSSLIMALTRGQRPMSQAYSLVFNLGQSCGQLSSRAKVCSSQVCAFTFRTQQWPSAKL